MTASGSLVYENCFSSKGRTSEGKCHFTQQSAMAALLNQEELDMWVEIVDELRQKHGRKPTPKQLAENTDMSIEDAKDILDAMPRFPPLKKSRVAAASDAEAGDVGGGAPKGGVGEGAAAPSAPSATIDLEVETQDMDAALQDADAHSVAPTQKYEPDLPMAQRALSFSDVEVCRTPVHAKQVLQNESPAEPELPAASMEACNLGTCVNCVVTCLCVLLCLLFGRRRSMYIGALAAKDAVARVPPLICNCQQLVGDPLFGC